MPEYPRKFHPEDDPIAKGLIVEQKNKHEHRTILYFGVSTSSHLERYSLANPRPDILVSYAFMSNEFLDTIKAH